MCVCFDGWQEFETRRTASVLKQDPNTQKVEENANLCTDWTGKQHSSTQKQTSNLAFHLIFHHFSPFNSCLIAVCSLVKGISQEVCRLCYCPNKQRSFEPFICLDLDD